MTNAELSQRSGIPMFQVAAMSQQVNWSGIDLPTMKRFLDACGLDLEDSIELKRAQTYMRGKRRNGFEVPPRFSRHQNAPHWESELRPLAKILIKHSYGITPRAN